MESYGNTMETINSPYSIEECNAKLETYANGIDVYSHLKTDNGTQIINMMFEKLSLRNGNFMIIFVNLVAENNHGTTVFFTIKERQEGFINFSFEKKQKIINQLTELLT